MVEWGVARGEKEVKGQAQGCSISAFVHGPTAPLVTITKQTFANLYPMLFMHLLALLDSILYFVSDVLIFICTEKCV